jgi:endonuclease YncB( thermonuclease family)
MVKDEKFQIRLSSELVDFCKSNFENVSLFIRESMREKVESGLLTDPSLSFVEIRCRTPYTYYAKLERVIDGDSIIINFDLGFYLNLKETVRLIGIDAPPIDTKKGKEAAEFIENELKNANLIVETRKKEKFGRYLGYIYYSKKYSDFTDIIRYGKLLNEELVKAGLANRYGVGKKQNIFV